MFASLRKYVLMTTMQQLSDQIRQWTRNLPTMIIRHNYTQFANKITKSYKATACTTRRRMEANSLTCKTALESVHDRNFHPGPRTSFVRKYSHPVIWRTVGIGYYSLPKSFFFHRIQLFFVFYFLIFVNSNHGTLDPIFLGIQDED